jgi:hypothetical protein
MQARITWLIRAAACSAILAHSALVFAQTGASPCTLLTASQVGAAIGTPVGAGTSLGMTCNWTAPGYITTLWLRNAGDWQRLKAPFPGRGVTKTAISGLGDDAFSSVASTADGSQAFATLSVLKGNTAFEIKVYSKLRSAPDQLAIEKTLAADILASLANP